MYAYLMKSTVVEFSPPTKIEEPLLCDLVKRFAVDPETATTDFVRVAKRRFSEKVGSQVERVVAQTIMAHPTWVIQASVCLCLEDVTDGVAEADMILRTLSRVSTAVLEETSGNAVMIGALQVKVHYLGSRFYNFSFKQGFTRGIKNADTK